MSTSDRNLARLTRQGGNDVDARRVLADLRCRPAEQGEATEGPTGLQRIGRLLAAAGGAKPGFSHPAWADQR